MKEKSLSDKRIAILVATGKRWKWGYRDKAVKQAIKRLKEELCECHMSPNKCVPCKRIDKLAGDKLTK